MRISVVFFSLLIGTCTATAVANAKPRAWPCRWIHGRMTYGNGTPATRIWPAGTHRMLGVVSRQHPVPDDRFSPDLPSNAARMLTPTNDTIWGDFFVCPITAEQAGWMRMVTVESAKRLLASRK